MGNLVLRFVTLSILSRMCIDSSNGTSDGIPPPLQNYISKNRILINFIIKSKIK
jgi:hypothetical protein